MIIGLQQFQDERVSLGQKYFSPELQKNNFQQTNLHLLQVTIMAQLPFFSATFFLFIATNDSTSFKKRSDTCMLMF